MPGNESTAKILGYSGLIPFIILSIASWLPTPLDTDVNTMLIAYAAIIFSFMGAVHWGIALSSKQGNSEHLMVSVIPALLAWPALIAPQIYALALLIIGFIALYFYDRYAIKVQQLPVWYMPMRKRLTVVVILCLSIALLSSILN